jgi:hypothetical protein
LLGRQLVFCSKARCLELSSRICVFYYYNYRYSVFRVQGESSIGLFICSEDSLPSA